MESRKMILMNLFAGKECPSFVRTLSFDWKGFVYMIFFFLPFFLSLCHLLSNVIWSFFSWFVFWFSFMFLSYLFVYFWRCCLCSCMGSSLVAASGSYSPVAVSRLLIAVASLVVEHRPQGRQASAVVVPGL